MRYNSLIDFIRQLFLLLLRYKDNHFRDQYIFVSKIFCIFVTHMATLYFHIPFCKRICSYCDFYKVGALSLLPNVVEVMHRELEERRDYLSSHHITSIYFGGGTPSLVQPSEIERFVSHARELFDCSAVEEITLEANPDDLTEEYVKELAKTSVNRVSLGIQSFDDGALRMMNRRHTAAEAVEAVQRLKRYGIDNISIDIIFGIAGYGGETLRNTLAEAIKLDVGHISAYHLTIEERTRLGLMTQRGEYTPISDEESEAEYMVVHEALTAAGYEHYEVSNYAKNGCRARHNSAYWQGVEYLGIGPGAHSFSRDNRTWCISSAKEYAEGVIRFESEELTELDHMNEYVMTSLRRIEGIDLSYIERCFGVQHKERIMAAAREWIEVGIVVVEGDMLAICPERFLVSDAVIEAFFV
jgi:oxygen-independent coproporphyrinogen-3 oxidase